MSFKKLKLFHCYLINIDCLLTISSLRNSAICCITESSLTIFSNKSSYIISWIGRGDLNANCRELVFEI